jgi:hypothetical protein
VLGEGLAGPVPGDLDPTAAEAEVLAVGGLVRAPPGLEAGLGVLGLDPNRSQFAHCGEQGR